QVAVDLLGNVENVADGVAGLDPARHVNAGSGLEVVELFQSLAAIVVEIHGENALAVGHHRAHGHVEENKVSAIVPGQRTGQAEGVRGLFGEIGRVKDGIDG